MFDDCYDPEANAHFVVEQFESADRSRLENILSNLKVADVISESDNPFCCEQPTPVGSLKSTVECVEDMLGRPFFATVIESDYVQSTKHIFGPHPPSNDGLEITTILQSPDTPGSVCILSVVKRVAANQFVVFDNHWT